MPGRQAPDAGFIYCFVGSPPTEVNPTMPIMRDRILLMALAASACLVGAGGWLLVAGPGPVVPDPSPLGLVSLNSPVSSASDAASGTIIVDVEGAVMRPGIIELPAGSRVGDALSAAGGYSDAADLAAAAAQINLAASLTDGAQIVVPVLGATPAGAGSGAGGSSGNGLVDLNHATPEELDTLPGIGPVTVQKIVAARTERPFTSLEETVEREVLNNGQLEKIRDLATVS